jgi:hypothetical protein
LHRCPRTGADIEHASTSICRPQRSAKRADGIADIREIADLLAIAKDLDGFAVSQPIGKNRNHTGIWRARILSRAVEIEETQSERRYSVHRSGYPGVQLAPKLVGAIGAKRRRRQLLANRDDAAITVNSGA